MTTTELDTLTDYNAKTNAGMFDPAEKLLYYNIAYGLLYALIIDEGEDNYEEEDTSTTVEGQRDYGAPARIRDIKWLKVDYGDGFIPAKYRSEQSLISEYGNELENALSTWDKSSPIYNFKGDHFFIYPAPTADQAGSDRLKASFELLPEDITGGATPDLPENFHYLLAEYAAHRYHQNNGETESALLRKKNFDEGAVMMKETMFPRARQQFIQSSAPNDDGSDY